MEKLILSCGRFSPQRGGSSDGRVAAMEEYLAKLTEELEFLLAELGRVSAAELGRASATASAAGDDGGEVV